MVISIVTNLHVLLFYFNIVEYLGRKETGNYSVTKQP